MEESVESKLLEGFPSDIAALEEAISRPPDYLIEAMGETEGDILILGAGGKMGPSLACMARRALDARNETNRRVIAVSRFSVASARVELEKTGVETFSCDLLDPVQIGELPDAANIVFMVGMKFGSSEHEALTWATNAYLPGLIAERYGQSRIVAFSTGNVYGMAPASHGGSLETDTLHPQGEYAMSALARERLFEYFSIARDIPTALIRLNYACDLRYGVLVDIARRVATGEPTPLNMGYFNTIWQGDANAMTLASLAHTQSPPFILNVTGKRILSVRQVTERFAELYEKHAGFIGTESPDALVSNAQKSFGLFGEPLLNEEKLIAWVAEWVRRNGPLLDKPTHFENREGKF